MAKSCLLSGLLIENTRVPTSWHWNTSMRSALNEKKNVSLSDIFKEDCSFFRLTTYPKDVEIFEDIYGK